MRILIDTNVILDFFLSREPNAQEAQTIFKMIDQGKIMAFTTASSITDIYYITAKRIGDDATRTILRHLFNLVSVITVDGSDCEMALELLIKDYEDALAVVCSEKEAIDYIVTNDIDFLKANPTSAPTISPKEFLDTLA